MVLGFARRWVYPAQALLNSASLLAVSKSVLDPWGWVFTGTNALFYPSLIIFAASLLLIALREDDTWVLDSVLTSDRTTTPGTTRIAVPGVRLWLDGSPHASRSPDDHSNLTADSLGAAGLCW